MRKKRSIAFARIVIERAVSGRGGVALQGWVAGL
jgi:hypothetical protein